MEQVSEKLRAVLDFAPDTTISKTRRLPVAGEVLVSEGDVITAEAIVARAEVPGYPVDVNVAFRLGIEAPDTSRYMLKSVGENVAEGEPLARRKILLGLSEELVVSPVSATIESISNLNGVVILRTPPVPVDIQAYVPGIVTKVMPAEGCVVEARGAMVQGLFGVGGETAGAIRIAVESRSDELKAEQIVWDMKGKILVAGSGMSKNALLRARDAGVRGVILGSIDDKELASFLGTEIGLAITGQEQTGLTVVVTEGFGDMPMSERIFALLKKHEGQVASLNGTTHIRAESVRPEIFVAKQ